MARKNRKNSNKNAQNTVVNPVQTIALKPVAKAVGLNPVESLKVIDEMITLAVTQVDTMQATIQKICIVIALHAYNHADYSRANVIMERLGDGVRKQALQGWFEDYCGLIVDEADASKGFTSWKKPEYIKKNLDAGKAKPWFKCKPAPTFKGFDFEDKLAQLLKSAQKQFNEKSKLLESEKDTDHDKANKINVTKEQLELLKKLAEKMEVGEKREDTAIVA